MSSMEISLIPEMPLKYDRLPRVIAHTTMQDHGRENSKIKRALRTTCLNGY